MTTQDGRPTVAVVITTYNHASYLDDSIGSVLAQTVPPDEIIVVDDGSKDSPETVTGKYPQVRLITQANQGLSAARNTGLKAATSELIVFLDADDMLTPVAIQYGLWALAKRPDAVLSYGGYRMVDKKGKPIGHPHFTAISDSPFEDMLRGNIIGMHGTVVFKRQALLDIGGYDTSLRMCEDYDVYFRLARKYPLVSFPEVVADYRWHGSNMSRNAYWMLTGALKVLERHAVDLSEEETAAAEAGRFLWRDYYSRTAFSDAIVHFRYLRLVKGVTSLYTSFRASPRSALDRINMGIRRFLKNNLPAPLLDVLLRFKRSDWVAFGQWRMGDFTRVRPASDEFGYERGTPLDRYYIENFLQEHSGDIKGRVLEIGDAAYCRRFGGTAITQQDVLHVHADNPEATIVGDMSDPSVLPSDAFDCMVLTQTLHLVYDMRAAVRETYRALKPGGVALVTSPGITSIDRGEWGESWYWSITPGLARRMFGEFFDPEDLEIVSNGNVYSAAAFLAGIALQEADKRKLDIVDTAYPVIVTIRARKRA